MIQNYYDIIWLSHHVGIELPTYLPFVVQFSVRKGRAELPCDIKTLCLTIDEFTKRGTCATHSVSNLYVTLIKVLFITLGLLRSL